MVCACGCSQQFEKERPNQRYLDARHRYRAQNRRTPLKRSKAFLVASPDGQGETQAACYGVVAGASGNTGAQPSGSRQFLSPGEILEEFRSIDRIIQHEQLLTPTEVAAVLGISVHTLHSWRGKTYRRDLKFINLAGKRVRYRLRDLKAWLDKLGVGQWNVREEAR